jgi:hypothetical protein
MQIRQSRRYKNFDYLKILAVEIQKLSLPLLLMLKILPGLRMHAAVEETSSHDGNSQISDRRRVSRYLAPHARTTDTHAICTPSKEMPMLVRWRARGGSLGSPVLGGHWSVTRTTNALPPARLKSAPKESNAAAAPPPILSTCAWT